MRFIQIKITREDLIISLIFLTTLQNPLRILFSSVHIMLEEVSFVKFGEMFFPKSIIKTAVSKEVIFSLSKTGLKINGDGKLKYEENEITLTSKTLDQIKEKKFIGIMTCSDAEKSCPIDQRSIRNIKMFYSDPKDFDKTNKKIPAYDDTCLKIAQELNYVIKKIN